MNKQRNKAILGVGLVENLLPKVLFPTPVGPRRTILGCGRVASVHPQVSALEVPMQWRTMKRKEKGSNMAPPRFTGPKMLRVK